MTNCIKKFYEETGTKTGFKPAGGVASPDEAITYYAIVKNVLGDAWLTPSLFRIGASRAANNLLSSSTGDEISYF
jgi:deoxyribose-phosphate aldolase